MRKSLINIIFGIFCLATISYWIYNGLKSNSNEVITIHNTVNNSDLIFHLLKKETSLVYDSIKSIDFISYLIVLLINILMNQSTHKITIDEILPFSLLKFYLYHTIRVH